MSFSRSNLLTSFLFATLILVACGKSAAPAAAQESKPAMKATFDKALEGKIAAAIDKGIRYLRSQQDPNTGALNFMPGNPDTRHPGITALAVAAYAKSPRHYRYGDGPFVDRALEWLAGLQKADGSIFQNDSANYVTSAAVMAFAAADDPAKPKWKDVLVKATDFVVRTQCSEDTGYRPGDKFYGGIGYGSSERPDLSNTHFALDAAKAGGLPQDHKLFKNATIFLQRCQNFSETNDQVWTDDKGAEIRPGNDGGAMYNPGESKAGIEVLADGRKVLRSYGSMSYALLKSYLFCGLDRNDPRVRAVAKWCLENFTVDKHPGFEPGEKNNEQYQGLFYYYYSLAKAMRAYGRNEVTTPEGPADWRVVLATHLLELQKEDGTFVNSKNGRWQESSSVLCTCYALHALIEILAANP